VLPLPPTLRVVGRSGQQVWRQTMFTVGARVLHGGTPARLTRRFTAVTCALALVVMLTGNLAAAEPVLEGSQCSAPGLSPDLGPTTSRDRWLDVKLSRTAAV
jgi:hypothetical protein